MLGRRSESCFSVSLSRTTTKRHGCVLRELPDQRATSRIWLRSPSLTSPGSYWRTWRTARTASSASAVLLIVGAMTPPAVKTAVRAVIVPQAGALSALSEAVPADDL